MKVGYALVSNFDNDRSIQINALQQAGCKQIITDQIDGVGKDHPGLETALSLMREGDILVVWRLALLGRSLKQIVGYCRRSQDGARAANLEVLVVARGTSSSQAIRRSRLMAAAVAICCICVLASPR